MALTRAQLLMGDSSQGPILAGQVQAVKAGAGISIDSSGIITVDSQTVIGLMKLGQTAVTAAAAYNSYEWPIAVGTPGQQITIQTVGGVATLAWSDPDQIPWTLKGQLVVGTGVGTQDLLNVGTNGQILIADSSTTTGLAYTINYVATSGPTAAANIPAGAPALRPVTPPAGAFRYNSTSTSLEFYNGVAWETVASSSTNDFVEKTSDVGIALIPAGTTLQRPAPSFYTGAFRYNTSLNTLEFSNGITWIQLVQLNNPVGYNAYVWPNADGAYGSFLQTDASNNLSWKQPAFVGTAAPSPPNDGMLWFDCNVGYFKVYQSCVQPVGWTRVAEPGLAVLPINTTAVPVFSGGSGTSASPYIYSTTTSIVGLSVLIASVVTITGLAPNQFVPIIDLNAVTNGGRFSFSNTYADNLGTLVFQVIFKDQPGSLPGTSYTAAIKVGYGTVFANSVVNLVPALTVTGGSIAGSPTVGSTLTYTPGVASGGTGAYTYAWTWRVLSTDAILQTNGPTYVVPNSLLGGNVYVKIVATDSSSATATADASPYPTPPATFASGVFPNTVFSPVSGPNAVPASVNTATLKGTATATWADGTPPLTSTGSILFRVNSGAYGTGPTAVINGDTVDLIWDPVAAAAAADGAILTGTLTNGIYTNNYSLTISRAVTGLVFSDLSNQAKSVAITSNVITPSGFNVPVTLTLTGTSTNPLTSLVASAGGNAYTASPKSVNPGDTLQINGTTGSVSLTDYGLVASMGSSPVATTTWTVTTGSGTPTIDTPTILTPADNSTSVGDSTGIVVTASTYSPQNGAGAIQTLSTWEVSDGGIPLESTNAITSISTTPSTWVLHDKTATFTNVFGAVGGISSSAYGATSSGGLYQGNASLNPPLTTSSPIQRIFQSTAGTGYLIALAGAQIYTVPYTGMGSWVPSTNPTAGVNYTGFIDVPQTNQVYLTGPNNAMIESSDGGATWVSIGGPFPGTNLITAVNAIAQSGYIFGGTQFTPFPTGSPTSLPGGITTPIVSAYCVGTSGIVALSQNGGIAVSINGGSSWTLGRAEGGGTNWASINGNYAVTANGSNASSSTVPGDISTPWIPFSTTNLSAVGTINQNAFSTSTRFFTGQNGFTLPDSGTTILTIAGCLTDGFTTGKQIVSVPSGGGINVIDSLTNTEVVLGSNRPNGWAIGQKLKLNLAPLAGSPYTDNAAPFESLSIPKPPLGIFRKYAVRVKYETSNATATTSNFSPWSVFTTGFL